VEELSCSRELAYKEIIQALLSIEEDDCDMFILLESVQFMLSVMNVPRSRTLKQTRTASLRTE